MFTVCDEGIGVPDADLKQLFQTFHRGSNVGERPGTGLGLVIVKRCVELHDGTLQLNSKLAEGTTVTVRLPLAAELFKENSLLLLKVFDHGLLMAVHPPSDGQQQELKVNGHDSMKTSKGVATQSPGHVS